MKIFLAKVIMIIVIMIISYYVEFEVMVIAILAATYAQISIKKTK